MKGFALLGLCATVALVCLPARVHAQMAPGAPSIASTTVGTGDITVTWTAPGSDGGSTITSYDLGYIENDATDKADANWTVIEDVWVTGGGALSYVLEGLRDSTGYDVRLRAENAEGAGDWSASSTATTSDHGDAAADATTITLGGSIHGRIDAAGDDDYFELVLASDTDVWIYATGDLDTAGSVTEDGASSETASNADGHLPPNPLNFSIQEELDAGTWHIAVGGEDGEHTGDYTLHVRAETAAGTSFATATTVTLGSLTPGRLSAGGTDYFRIDLASATDLWVLSIGETDVKATLFNSGFGSVVANEDSELTNRSNAFSLRTNAGAGAYYVAVSGDRNRTAGPYTLYVHAVTDPGSTRDAASPLRVGMPEPGRIGTAGNEDYFTFTLDSATHLRLDAHGPGASLQLTPTLYDDGGTELDLYYVDGRTWPRVSDRDLGFWALEHLAAGTYSLGIKASTATQTGAYVLNTFVETEMHEQEEACLALNTSSYSDPLYGCQWHLKNTDQFGSGGGQDINVEEAWTTTLGEGINVLVVDAGLDYLHSDLRGYEYMSTVAGDTSMGHHDLTGEGVRNHEAEHGTNVGGIIAARDNEVGGRGVAPRATVYGFNMFTGGLGIVFDNMALAAGYLTDQTAVSNNSWRYPAQGYYFNARPGWEEAVESAITTGYGGKGVYYVWIAGNGHPEGHANMDEIQSHYAVTTVCAVDYNDVRSTYSEIGPNLWVCAPSQDANGNLPGIVTPTVGNTYTTGFTGTSAAAPIVSGVAALVRAANTDLTWRDVKLILAASARKNDASNSGWEEGAFEYGSATERYSFNHEYGFGMVDAGAAVELALNWSLLPPFREVSSTTSVRMAIPDRPEGQDPVTISSTTTLGPSVDFIEFMAIEVSFRHPDAQDLRVVLTSPAGSRSTLVVPYEPGSRNYNSAFRFGSAKHLGESAAGEWTLEVSDEFTGDSGNLRWWKLTAYGHGYAPDAPAITSATGAPRSVVLAWSAPEYAGASDITSYDVRYILSDATDKTDANWTVVEDVWSSGDLAYTLSGLGAGAGYDLQMRAVNDDGDGFWSETVAATLPDVPDAPAISTISPRDGELVVSWAVPAGDGGSSIESYDIRTIQSDATDKADANWSEQTGVWTADPGGDLQHVLSLVNDTRYDVQVRAVNAVGDGAWSATRTGTPRILNHDPEFPATETGTRSVNENTAAGVNIGAAVRASDAESDTLTYRLVTGGANFDIVETTGQLQTRAALDHEDTTTYTVTVDVSDGTDTNGETDTRIDDTITVTVTVENVDEPPEVGGTASYRIDENSAMLVGVYSAADPEGTAITWESLAGSDASHFEYTESGGSLVLSFKASPDFEARSDDTYEVQVRASDEGGKVGGLLVTITVVDVNEPPVVSGPVSIDVNEGHTGTLGAFTKRDPERQATNWGVVGGAEALTGADAAAFAFNQTSGALTFVDPPDFESGQAQYTVTVNANDGVSSDAYAVTVNVANVEESGSLSLGAQRGVINVPLVATLTDPDGVVSVDWQWQRSTSRSGPWSDIDGATSSSYTPVAADRDQYLRATATYEDGFDAGNEANAVTEHTTANARGSNTPPELPASVDDIAIPENTPAGRNVGSPVRGTDNENDPLVYTLSGASEFVIGRTSGQLAVAADAAFDFDTPPTSYTVTVTADDGFGGQDTVAVTITLTNVNEPPVAEDDAPPSFDEDTSATIDVLANDSDPEDDPGDLMVSIQRRPSNGSVAVNTPVNPGERPTITYTPRANYHGSDSFTYRVQDTGNLNSSVATVALTVDPVNDAPAFVEATAVRSVSELAGDGDEVGAPLAATDIDGDLLTYTLSGGGGAFDIDEHSGQITVAGRLTVGDHVVTVTASDPDGETADIEVTITVTAGPVTPIIFTGGGGGGPSGPTPSEAEFEWNVKRDIEALDSGHDNPSGSWSDGAILWLAENGDGADDAVYAYDLATGERVEDREFPLDQRNRAPRGVASDGTTVWVADSGQDRLFAYDLATGERLEDRDIVLAEGNGDVRGIWSDGTTMWVLNRNPSLFAYDHATGALLAQYALNSGNSDPRGIWSDGDVMYVADASDGRVYTYNMPDAIDARLASLDLSGIDIGTFDPATTDYEGVPGEGVTQTTVTVTSADGLRTRVYRVRLGESEELALEQGFTAIEWTGFDGVTVAEALGDLTDSVVAVYAWDEVAGTWLAYFPAIADVPGLNTLESLERDRTYWIAATEALSWAVPVP